MNFGEALSSDSIERHAHAALFLQGQGASGYEFLPLLLQRCQSIDLSQLTLSKHEVTLVGCGAVSLGTIVGTRGFDAGDAFHAKVLNWLMELTYSSHIQVFGYGIYGLGALRPLPESAIERLVNLVGSERRADEHGIISSRGIAFRVLAQADHALARPFAGSPACDEYLCAIDTWIADYRQRFPNNRVGLNEIEEEPRWLRSQMSRTEDIE